MTDFLRVRLMAEKKRQERMHQQRDQDSFKENQNYYDMLEIAPSASSEDITKSYLRLKSAYSGENLAIYSLLSPDDCKQLLDNIELAYSVLGVLEKRKEYDQLKGFNKEKNYNISNVQSPDDRENSNIYNLHLRQEAETSKFSAGARFGLKYEINPSFEQKIEETEVFTGKVLQGIREYKNVDINRLAEMTRISKTHLRYIEEENVAALPAAVYTRGFVFQYAKVLKLNPDLVASSYMNHLKNLAKSS